MNFLKVWFICLHVLGDYLWYNNIIKHLKKYYSILICHFSVYSPLMSVLPILIAWLNSNYVGYKNPALISSPLSASGYYTVNAQLASLRWAIVSDVSQLLLVLVRRQFVHAITHSYSKVNILDNAKDDIYTETALQITIDLNKVWIV